MGEWMDGRVKMNRQEIDGQMDGVISLVLVLPLITYILMSQFIILIFLLPGFIKALSV